MYATIAAPSGGFVYRPSWVSILESERNARKEMCRLMNTKRRTMKDAISDVMACPKFFQKYFITPHSLAAGAAAAENARGSASTSGRRPLPQPLVDLDLIARSPQGPGLFPPPLPALLPPPPTPHPEGRRPKPKAKAKSEARPNSWRFGESKFTPDRKEKCGPFQRGRCQGNCNRVHVCWVCNGPHGDRQCPRRPPQQGDSAGRLQHLPAGGGQLQR